jgi:hypothetical protein
MASEVYEHVPDLSWPRWPERARPLYDFLSQPATTDDVVSWSLGPRFGVGGPKMGASRRASYVRNMLAWLSLRGVVDHAGGKWRRVRARRTR